MSEPLSTAEIRTPRGLRHAPWLWLVGALTYASVLWYLGWNDVRRALESIQVPWLVAMVALEAVLLWGRAWKWRLGVGPGGDAFRLYFMAKAAGNLTPGRVGELTPLLFARHRSPRVAAWIILDRLLEIGATLALGAVGAVVVGVAISDSMALPPWSIAAGWSVAAFVMVAAPLFLITRHAWLAKFAGRFPAGGRLARWTLWIAEVSRETRAFRRRTPVLALITLGATAADVFVGMLLYGSFGFWLPFALLAAAQCLHALVSAVPITPNATGVPYMATAFLIFKIGGVPPEVLALAIPVRMALAGGLFWVSFGAAMAWRRRDDA